MEFKVLNSHFLPLGYEIVCNGCDSGRKAPSSPKASTNKSFRVVPNQKPLNGEIRRTFKKKWPSKPAKIEKRPRKNRREGETPERKPLVPLPGDGRSGWIEVSPILQRLSAKNFDLNLNFNTPLVVPESPLQRQLFENTLYTPIKMADVYFHSGSKFARLKNLELPPLPHASADPRRFTSVDSENAREFVFDTFDRPKQLDMPFPFKNAPSCFQSPFIPLHHPFEAPVKTKNINFEAIPKSLDFLENPFLMEFD